ncbi:MAG: hypothetical protein OXG27_06950, partial [Chloroflexi bacterium]|nr:hypothetical protein [Chloroflexota bacterium]
MNAPTIDSLHRTAKIELDEGRARTVEHMQRIVNQYVLQIDVGCRVTSSATHQAALLTAVNAARRAFIGGVRVRVRKDGPLIVRWAKGMSLSESVEAFGGTVVRSLSDEYCTLAIGNLPERPAGSRVLYITWQGWSGGVVEEQADRLPETHGFPLAGMLAGALGVSETFQHIRGYPVAGRRPVGLSLWDPTKDWRDESAFGAVGHYLLPSRLWLIGLGHLGQAYAWAVGLLPYSNPTEVSLMLQDFDTIAEANESTGMLSDDSSVGRKKTRAVASRLEDLGFCTSISERTFDSCTQRSANEPGLALVGVDDPEPRHVLENARFDLIVDAGLGGGPRSYLDILVHSFPSGIQAAAAWSGQRRSMEAAAADQPAYRALGHQIAATTTQPEGEIRCGILELAGRS